MSTNRNRRNDSLHKRHLGNASEEFAAQFVSRSLGWTILVRNWRCRFGELDIIAKDQGTLVIVEVRSRSQSNLGAVEEAVDERKLRQLRRVIPIFLQSVEATESCVRVDAIVIYFPHAQITSMNHFRNVLVLN